MNKEEIRQFKSLLKQGSLRHMNIILDDKFQKSLLEIIKDYEEKDKQIYQLTNNWNALEEWVKEKVNGDWDFSTGERNAYDAYDNVLDKMKEIKEGHDNTMDSKVFIRIKDKKAGYESSEVTIEDLIFNQHDIYFEFPNGGQVPYKDFLFFQEDYEVIVRIGENG